MRGIALERKFGLELKMLAEEAAELDVVDGALNLAERQLRREAGLPEGEKADNLEADQDQ